MKARKARARLRGRQQDFDRGSQSKEGKVQNRWDAGGYHRPGSLKK